MQMNVMGQLGQVYSTSPVCVDVCSCKLGVENLDFSVSEPHTYPQILWTLKCLFAHPALELSLTEVVVVDVALQGSGIGGCLVADVTAVLVARRLVYRFHVLL